MTRVIIFLASMIFAAASLPTLSAIAQDNRSNDSKISIGIATGSESGTYFRFGQEISTLIEAGDSGVELNVITTAGSIANVVRLYSERDTQLAIVQSDVLRYVKDKAVNKEKIQDESATSIADGLRLVYGLYDEEVHILAKKGRFDSFEDLDGGVVAVGMRTSGGVITALNLKNLAGINFDFAELEGEDAIQAVIEGQVDAYLYVAGKPTAIFTELATSPVKDEVEFLPVKSAAVYDEYGESFLSSDYYVFLEPDTKIMVPVVQASLITFAYGGSTNPSSIAKCASVRKVATAIVKSHTYIKNIGHSKWDQVTFREKLPGWQLSNCVDGAYKLPDTRPEPDPSVEDEETPSITIIPPEDL